MSGGPRHEEVAVTDRDLDIERRRIGLEKDRADLGLRRLVANWALGLALAQIVVADVGFFIYGFTNHWHVPAAAIDAWLAATVVEVISVVLVITRYLFPADERSD